VEYGWLTIVPPLVAITLALLTKQVIISLLIGILSGSFILANFSPVGAISLSAMTMWENVTDPWNVAILVFLVTLGILTYLMVIAGGAAAYGEWATKRIKSRAGAQLASLLLGIIIFIDDYFNCLTVGTVMIPVTDRFRVSRAKLAYIIDSTAAPVCVLAPVSSWVVTIMSTMGDKFRDVGITVEPFTAFIKTLPMNLYAWATLVMVAFVAVTELDFGPMGRFEREAKATGDVYGPRASEGKVKLPKISKKGTVPDLVVPVIGLIGFAIVMMAYTGGYFVENIGFLDAIKNTDAATALMYAGFLALALALVMFLSRGIISVGRLPEAAWQGFLSMVPAMLILCFAWTIGGIINQLGTGLFLATRVGQALNPVLYPVIMFILSCIIAFATGTSWGTFAIMIPIAVDFAVLLAPNLLIGMIGAVLAGAVYGDHCSPISDTTILSSTGAGCNHIDHVSTQLPYATVSAVMCGIGYIVYGFMAQSGVSTAVTIAVSFLVTLGLLAIVLKGLNALTSGSEFKIGSRRRVA
jgi:tetracycline resistance efflux pump